MVNGMKKRGMENKQKPQPVQAKDDETTLLFRKRATQEQDEEEQVSSPKRSASKLWWDALTPPFDVQDTYGNSDDTDEEPFVLEPTVIENPHVTHFCFLVHGHRGCAKDLSYLQTVMEILGERVKKRQAELSEPNLHDVVVHAAICNEQRTNDGVEKGGERLAEEMVEVIRHEMAKRIRKIDKSQHHVTISVVGNSLGGIYSRYAIVKLSNYTSGTNLLDGRYRLDYNVFCTTASPHLGISQHTYVPLPRTAEIGVAKALGTTGHDLFRLNDLMLTMGTSREFLDPLGSFRKRVAYANAYGTDFPVPAETAAFLNPNSTYPHYFVEDDNSDAEDDRIVMDDNGLIIATLHTLRNDSSAGDNGVQHVVDEEHTDELVQMSTALDSLGWKKVFVDIRSEIPITVSIPWLTRRSSSGSSNSPNTTRRAFSFLFDRSSDESEEQEESSDDVVQEEEPPHPPIDELKEKGGVLESRHVVSAFAVPKDNRVHLPVGHNMICAVSRSRLSTLMNKGGRPVMDTLARDLVQDIFSWTESD